MGRNCYGKPHMGSPTHSRCSGAPLHLTPHPSYTVGVPISVSSYDTVMPGYVPIELAGSWPVDQIPSLMLDLPFHYGIAQWLWDCVWLFISGLILTCVSGFILDLPRHHKLDLQLAPTAPYIKRIKVGNWLGLHEMQGLVCLKNIEVLPLPDLFSVPLVRKVSQMEQSIVILTSMCTWHEMCPFPSFCTSKNPWLKLGTYMDVLVFACLVWVHSCKGYHSDMACPS